MVQCPKKADNEGLIIHGTATNAVLSQVRNRSVICEVSWDGRRCVMRGRHAGDRTVFTVA